MNIFFIFIISVLSFCGGCRREDKKPTFKSRSVYDQPVFVSAIAQALCDEESFKTFKRDPFYSLIFQGHSYEEGLAILDSIEKDYPFLIKTFDRFRTSDLIGGPKVFNYGKYGTFSPTTLHHVRIAGMIQMKIGELPSGNIIQIGSGYGGLCKILHDLSYWKKYTIVDLPEHLTLARLVLEKEGIDNVQFLTPQEVAKDGAYDLVISDLSFSEFSCPMQQLFIDRIFLPTRAGFLLGHTFPRYFGIESLPPSTFKEVLEKAKQNVHFEIADAPIERTTYSLLWNFKIEERMKKT